MRKNITIIIAVFLVLILSSLLVIFLSDSDRMASNKMISNEEVSPDVIEWLDQYEEPFYLPEEGFVPDKETAIRIAEAVWIPIYGEEQIKSERPFKAILVGDIWYVTGTLPEEYVLGGVAMAKISKKDGKIIQIVHGE